MILFNEIIFGPVKSRRLGISLGINLLPTHAKICSFDCIYCECGFNLRIKDAQLPSRKDVYRALETKLQEMIADALLPDNITFAGNGEPTMHKEFLPIIEDTLFLRDKYCPKAKVSVLSNSAHMHKPYIFKALTMVDNNILKFDSAIDETVSRLNRPISKTFNTRWQIEYFKKFGGKLIIQTMFLRGNLQDGVIDNTTAEEISAWLEALKLIQPQQVMIYTFERETPTAGLEKVGLDELNQIAARVSDLGIAVSVSD